MIKEICMKDSMGNELKYGDYVDVKFYSYGEPIAQCLYYVTGDNELEILNGNEPKEYDRKILEKIIN